METKTYKLEVRVKGCDETFDPRLAPGVVASQELTLSSKKGKEDRFATDLAMALHDRKQQLLEEVIEVVITEV